MFVLLSDDHLGEFQTVLLPQLLIFVTGARRPHYYNNSRKIISLIVLDEVGIEEGTQRTLEFSVALGLEEEGLPSLRVDEHSLRKYQIL